MTDIKNKDHLVNVSLVYAEPDEPEIGSKDAPVIVTDAVFGEIDAKGPNYRNVGWIGSSIIMIKATIGIGVLGIPFCFQVLGMVPGIICLVAVEVIVTWANWSLGRFKLKHPEVYSMADAAGVMFGRTGYWAMWFMWTISMISASGFCMVSLSVAFNAVSVHAACTSVFVAVSAVIAILCASIRTLGHITWIGWAGVLSIMVSILTLTVAVGVQERPAMAPQQGPWDKNVLVVGHPPFGTGVVMVSSFLLSVAATPTFLGILCEMRDHRMYNRAMYISQASTSIVYIVIGSVVYHFCGQYVSSPALGSAGPLLKRISYGLAIPGLVATVTIYLHVVAKMVFVLLLRGSKHLTSNSAVHWGIWLSCTTGCGLIGFILAQSIPVFPQYMGLNGSFFLPWTSLIPCACMWLHDNWRGKPRERTLGLKLHAAFAVFVLLCGLFLCGAGTYGAINDIVASSKGQAWSCKDNSGSVSE